jgi:hypothetical protein
VVRYYSKTDLLMSKKANKGLDGTVPKDDGRGDVRLEPSAAAVRFVRQFARAYKRDVRLPGELGDIMPN